MSAYLIANIDVNEPDKFKEYLRQTPQIVRKFGGKFLVRGGEMAVCEGNWNPKRLVMVKFESLEMAKQFYNSEEYATVRKIRQDSTYTEWVFVEGISDEMKNALNRE